MPDQPEDVFVIFRLPDSQHYKQVGESRIKYDLSLLSALSYLFADL